MNGGQSSNNEFLLDGAPNNANQGGNNIAYVPPAAAVQEMKISTNSYDAQYGRTAGGVVNVSLKSGTNSFHGEVYDYMRRKALAANSFILNTTSRPKTDQYIDQYGFSVDGPIFKNKTFFLFTGEKYREGTPAPLTSTVPTAAMRNGDFSGVVDAPGRQIVIYDPATGRADANGNWIRDPFPGNIIPANRINPTARALMQYWPEPNGSTAGVAPWQTNLLWPEHFNKDLFWNWVGKVDHNFGANDRVFFRWGENERNEIGNRGQRHPQRSRPGRPASALARQPRARRRLGAHLRSRARCSTCAPATPISWSGAIPSSRTASTRRSSGPRASSTRCQARTLAASSRVITGSESDFATLSRG